MRFQRGERDEPEINLIPFIDILLVVLIFLMLTTTFNRATVARMAIGAALLSAIAGIAISLLTGGPA